MPPKFNELVRKEIGEMIKAEIIVPSNSAWPFSLVIAANNDGFTWFCVN